MIPSTRQNQAQLEESHDWVGGEATVGTQAERYVRRREGRVKGLFTTIIGLTFIGGLAMGGAISQLVRKRNPHT